MRQGFIVKGDIAYAKENRELCCMEDSYLVCVDGKCKGVFSRIPTEYQELSLSDYSGKLIIPGMTDLHVHAPQYTFRGLGMDLELLEWLQTNTFPEEAKYENVHYATKAYQFFTEDLKTSYTTRACIFSTLHREATEVLMDQLEETGLITYVGKVNMDRNGSKELCEESAEASIRDTELWLQEIKGKYKRTMPILTPRFIPSCSDELMKKIAHLSKERGLRIQSHLSENPSEVAWVRELVPSAGSYAGAYELFEALGNKEYPAIMAHCVYSGEEEIALLKAHGTYVAHCPESNMNVSSGIAPIRKFLEAGLHVGLGTDVAGGSSLSMTKAMSIAMQASKMYWRLVDSNVKPLVFSDLFYIATLGGGSYFGKVGSFLEGYEMDAVVVDDSLIHSMRTLNLQERLERLIYQEPYCRIEGKYVNGCKIQ